MEFTDRDLTCVDCRKAFTFTAGEQEFYDRKGFKEIPKRCKLCRDGRKLRKGSERVVPQADGSPAPAPRKLPRGSRPPGEMFEAVCGGCGGQARVPFRPTAGRPVYCQDCFNKGS